MSRGSLRARLVGAGTLAILLALAIAGVALVQLFGAHVRRLATEDLSRHLDAVIAGLERAADGTLDMDAPLADPRFAQPFSGLYWQVEAAGGVLVSRSLWDATLPLDETPPDPGALRVGRLEGPLGAALLVVERQVALPQDLGGGAARVAVAMDSAGFRAAVRDFASDLAPYLGLLALALIAAGWAQVAVGLRPLRTVGRRLGAIRSGARVRLGDAFPAEVRPLAAEVDALLDARDADLARARARAADLAHGLKTPLQALIGEADRLRAHGQPESADAVAEIAAAMRAHVDRELVRARIAGHARGTSDPAIVAARLLAVLRRTPEGARLDWRLPEPGGPLARIEAGDLAEALGALMENAARHARAAVRLRCRAEGETVAITVADDGVGIPAERRAALMARGARADARGHGLGLAIAATVAEAAGGTLGLGDADPGLVATLRLPRVPTAPDGRPPE